MLLFTSLKGVMADVGLGYTLKMQDTRRNGTLNINKGNIEKIRKNHKCHHNILDQEIGFIRNVLKEEKIEHDVVEL